MAYDICSHGDCTQPRTEHSRFCEAHKLSHRHLAKDITRIPPGVFAPQRGAVVQYPGCALQDHMSKETARGWLKCGAFPMGTVLLIGNERVEVR